MSEWTMFESHLNSATLLCFILNGCDIESFFLLISMVRKDENYDNVTFAGLCTKQACSLTSEEYNMWSLGVSVSPWCLTYGSIEMANPVIWILQLKWHRNWLIVQCWSISVHLSVLQAALLLPLCRPESPHRTKQFKTSLLPPGVLKLHCGSMQVTTCQFHKVTKTICPVLLCEALLCEI